jgi:RNA polymerase sigma factor for flagellar operon FliA
MEPDRQLWEEFRRTRLASLREQLIERHMELTHRIAGSLYARRVNDSVSFDDYLQYGRVGLLEAVDRYDPTRGASFTTFANYRISGAIRSGLERCTELAAVQAAHRRRRLRERTESLEAAEREAMEEPLARGREDVAHGLEDLAQGSSGLEPFTGLVNVAIMLAMGYVLEEDGRWNPAGPDPSQDLYRSVQMESVRARLHLLVDTLPERERLIVRGHYFDRLEFQMIAEQLQITKGRVAQLHARALRLVREAYEALEEFDLDF